MVIGSNDKPCTKCGKVLPATRECFCLDNRNRTGLAGRCRECDRKAYRAPRRRARALKSKYGMEEKDYTKLFNRQGGYCLICSRHQSTMKRSLCVDHDHKTGKVRGLICNECNLVLGWSKEDVYTLKQAIKYIENGRNKVCQIQTETRQ